MTASKVLENVEVVEVQISQADNMFRCNKCERSFKLYCHLKQHIKSHLGSLERPHVCSHCGKAYTREGALKQHINTFHFEAEELSRNQKPQKKVHVCEYCKKNFDHFGHFKEHLRKHTGENKSSTTLKNYQKCVYRAYCVVFLVSFSKHHFLDSYLSLQNYKLTLKPNLESTLKQRKCSLKIN